MNQELAEVLLGVAICMFLALLITAGLNRLIRWASGR